MIMFDALPIIDVQNCWQGFLFFFVFFKKKKKKILFAAMVQLVLLTLQYPMKRVLGTTHLLGRLFTSLFIGRCIAHQCSLIRVIRDDYLSFF